MKHTISPTIKKEEPFDLVKLEWSNKSKDDHETNTIVRYKGLSFCLTKSNMDLIIDFIKRFNHD